MERKFMSIEEMKKYEWVVPFSGGKDSMATIILMRKYKIPIKKIIHVRMMLDDNTPAQFPETVSYVNKMVNKFTTLGYNVEIYKTKPATDLFNLKYKRPKYNYLKNKRYSLTQLTNRFCKLSSYKFVTFNDFVMLGLTRDEEKRIVKKGNNFQSILYELNISQKGSYNICKKLNLLNPLYSLEFKRDGCFFCPNIKEKEFIYLLNNHKNLLKKMYKEIKYIDKNIIKNYDFSNRNNFYKYFKKYEEIILGDFYE